MRLRSRLKSDKIDYETWYWELYCRSSMIKKTNQFLTPLLCLNFFRSAACWLYNQKVTLIAFGYASGPWLSLNRIISIVYASTTGWLLKISINVCSIGTVSPKVTLTSQHFAFRLDHSYLCESINLSFLQMAPFFRLS